MYEDVPVAQLDRVSASDAEGRGFESLRVRHTLWFDESNNKLNGELTV